MTLSAAMNEDGRRAWLRRQLDPAAQTQGLSLVNSGLVAAILTSGLFAVLDTEPTISGPHTQFFSAAELVFGLLFALEYGLRLWLAGEGASSAAWRARLRWAVSLPALVDLAALLPMLLALGSPVALLRLLRLVRILRLAKLGRFSGAWRVMGEAVHERRYELALSLCAALAAMLLAASLLYVVEGPLQPDKFGSIPRALWWAAMTLTTIGYGDVYPQSPLGRALAAAFAFVGIGLIAAPTGILAAAFSAAYQRRNRAAADRGEI
jgi:voltage-gated potassium channel